MQRSYKHFNTHFFIFLASLFFISGANLFCQSKSDALELFSVSATSVSSSQLDLEFSFDSRLDPSSIDESSILINGKESSFEGKVVFSKDGSRFKIRINSSLKEFNLSVQGILSDEGMEMSPAEIDGLEAGCTYTKRSPSKWEKS